LNLLQFFLAKRVQAALKLGLELFHSASIEFASFEYNFRVATTIRRAPERRLGGV
jgi:hypothetical protein